jgi:hypothetical protein
MFTIESATNPSYSSEDQNSIHLDVKFAEFNEIIPFNAMPTDTVKHGVDLYNRAKLGEFGEIAPYVAPPQSPQPKTTGTKSA